jgi:hypothetical protein
MSRKRGLIFLSSRSAAIGFSEDAMTDQHALSRLHRKRCFDRTFS